MLPGAAICCNRSSTDASSFAGELTDAERRQLFEAREQRPKPARDDKAIASWNGLVLAALAEPAGGSSGTTSSSRP